MISMEIETNNISIKHLDKLHQIEKERFEREAFAKPQLTHLFADYNPLEVAAVVNNEIAGFIIT